MTICKEEKYFMGRYLKEISLSPELSSPARFRIRGGGPLNILDKGQTLFSLILDGVTDICAGFGRDMNILGSQMGVFGSQLGDEMGSLGSQVGDLGSSLGQHFGDFGSQVGDWGSRINQEVEREVGHLGKEIGDLGDQIGQEMGDFGSQIGQEMGDFGSHMGSLGGSVGGLIDHLHSSMGGRNDPFGQGFMGMFGNVSPFTVSHHISIISLYRFYDRGGRGSMCARRGR